jgi:Thermolysin metallopeptidase, alpha-helical domain
LCLSRGASADLGRPFSTAPSHLAGRQNPHPASCYPPAAVIGHGPQPYSPSQFRPNSAKTHTLSLGGHAWEKAGRIWYETLRDPRLTSEAKFVEFASLSTSLAGRLYGTGSDEQRAVTDAWMEVGILQKQMV